MRLTAELIRDSLSYLNPLKERELDLRAGRIRVGSLLGHRIPAIENLGVAGPHDSIDFTDNDIQILGNFPLSPRISTLLLARNRVSSIQPTLPNAIPNLQQLVLASNNVAELADLDALAGFKRLTHLVLVDNPVTKKENYRYWVVWRCPTVRFLDYHKVKEAEREKARELFGTADEPTATASKIMGIKSKTLDVSATNGAAGAPSKLSRIKLTEKEKERLKEMIKKADSLQEIIRLEKMLTEGTIPAGVHLDGDATMEG
ncbi:u2 small nuclear ribonucleoprotein a [Colletotrichum karsti]|uniref:U2 small nuclear ribonucleoprotein A' n=1 Tax=Colletotrichum karsti TaxID=1095194 RepID=A0A9P6LR29_9PEZI|nr:u2 small nuclear ribonucleoprotein a [Colletotrichum karsti]KAF9881747.1 u2 small nuclear ribonucleoprotein a [Colletotrichum karsti]